MDNTRLHLGFVIPANRPKLDSSVLVSMFSGVQRFSLLTSCRRPLDFEPVRAGERNSDIILEILN
jgi:hypothetical protein